MGLRDKLSALLGGKREEQTVPAKPAAKAAAKNAAPKSSASVAAAARRTVAAGSKYTVWQYQAGAGACDACKTFHGRTVTQEKMPQRPTTCARMDCSAKYVVRADQRRGGRREKSDRREELRFDLKNDDRRQRSDRRKRTDGDWSDK
ncbi:MAG TPA: hypothetical protein VFL14_04770 [Xanthomonadales bacterium]|nr:hypothetical protein [Xanthomonadales bacterium]